ncbi:hypothetical protein DFH09DRAFT_1086311 [Mycena vulgaris]|nr:hypothetical protein DFH09DRAFT_1086311 [Mycena vulgaris]
MLNFQLIFASFTSFPTLRMLSHWLLPAFPFLCGSVLGSVVGNTTLPRSANASISLEICPLTFVGNVAAVTTDLTGSTHVYYQNADNSIQESTISGPFVRGTFDGSTLLVPADEALCGTPITATTISGTGFQLPDPCLFRIAQLHLERVCVDRNDLGRFA